MIGYFRLSPAGQKWNSFISLFRCKIVSPTIRGRRSLPSRSLSANVFKHLHSRMINCSNQLSYKVAWLLLPILF